MGVSPIRRIQRDPPRPDTPCMSASHTTLAAADTTYTTSSGCTITRVTLTVLTADGIGDVTFTHRDNQVGVLDAATLPGVRAYTTTLLLRDAEFTPQWCEQWWATYGPTVAAEYVARGVESLTGSDSDAGCACRGEAWLMETSPAGWPGWACWDCLTGGGGRPRHGRSHRRPSLWARATRAFRA